MNKNVDAVPLFPNLGIQQISSDVLASGDRSHFFTASSGNPGQEFLFHPSVSG